MPGDLAPGEERQRFAQAHLRARRLVAKRVELVADRGQLQPVQHREQRLMIDGRHHQPPPIVASYSASGRSSSGGGNGGDRRNGPAVSITPAMCARSTSVKFHA